MAAVAIRCETPSQLRQVLSARRRALGLRQLELDDLAGTQSGYQGKLEKGIRGYGDMSLSCTLGALGLELYVVERPTEECAPAAPRHYADRMLALSLERPHQGENS